MLWTLYLDGKPLVSCLSLDALLEVAWPFIAECRNVALVRKPDKGERDA